MARASSFVEIFGDRWEVITPDKDRYLEVLKPGRKGPLKLIRLNASGASPAGLKESVYRFKDYPSVELHNKRLKESFEDALKKYGGLVTVFPLVKDADGIGVGSDLIVGRRAATRRITGKTGATAPAGAAPALPILPSRPSKGDGWKEKLRIANGAPEGSAWVLAETVDDFLQVGAEVTLDAEQDYQVDATNALHNVGGRWARCELMKVVDIQALLRRFSLAMAKLPAAKVSRRQVW